MNTNWDLNDLGSFLAGLIEANGWFGDKQLHISFSSKDTPLAYLIKKRIGYGNVYPYKNKNAVRYICKNRIGMVIILGLINGKLTKIMQAFPAQIPPPPTNKKDENSNKNNDIDPVSKAKYLLEQGYVGRAAKTIIDPTPLAPETPKSLNILPKKHPIGNKNPFKARSQFLPGNTIITERMKGKSSRNKATDIILYVAMKRLYKELY